MYNVQCTMHNVHSKETFFLYNLKYIASLKTRKYKIFEYIMIVTKVSSIIYVDAVCLEHVH